MDTKLTGKTRIESDLIGAREIPAEALYGVQTLRGIENFSISKFRLSEYPLFIKGLAITKMAAAMANFELGLLTVEQKTLSSPLVGRFSMVNITTSSRWI